MNRGYIKIWRKSLDGGWLSNPNLWTFWCYCLLRANHKPCKVVLGFTEINLDSGQFIFGRKQAAKDIGLSEQTVRTCLQTLKSTSNITIKSTNKFSIISIINWSTYQDDEKISTNKSTNKSTNDQPTTNQQLTTDNNVKNVKNKDSEGENGIPEWIPKDLWADFREYRIRIKAPLTNRAIKNIIMKLETLKKEGQDPVACINEAITRGWRGVFAIKKEFTGKQSMMPRN